MPSRFYRVPLEQIAYVRAVVEGYDGVAVLHAPDPRRGEVELIIGEGLDDEARAIAARLTREAGWVEIERPRDWKSLAARGSGIMRAP
jgi:Domain of unknown function (DUF4911)